MDLQIPTNKTQQLGVDGKFLVVNVDYKTITALTNWIISNCAIGKNDFELFINSEGGSPRIILSFASFLKTVPNIKLTGVAFGECGSAALALLQCCTHRIAVEHCAFFIHHIQTQYKHNVQDPHILKKFELDILKSKKVEEEIVLMQCNRIGMERETWNRLADNGELTSGPTMFADEALKMGIVDEVVNSYPIF